MPPVPRQGFRMRIVIFAHQDMPDDLFPESTRGGVGLQIFTAVVRRWHGDDEAVEVIIEIPRLQHLGLHARGTQED